MAQSAVVMLLMVINNVIWIKRKTFSTFWHTLHYFFAAGLICLFIPRRDWWPCMMDPKFGYVNMNLFIY